MKSRSSVTAVVLGGYVNGYGIVQSLHDAGITAIYVVDTSRSSATYSSLIQGRRIIDELDDLPSVLVKLAEEIGYLVLYPTSDAHIEVLARNANLLSNSCFLPFNSSNALAVDSKAVQYAAADAAGVARPATMTVGRLEDWDDVLAMTYPVLFKPDRRIDGAPGQYRNHRVETARDAIVRRAQLLSPLDLGVNVLASEIIPGGDENVYAYTAYRSVDGQILRSWTGRKLAQYPDAFGVFSSGTACIQPGLDEAGAALVESLNCIGLIQPEFKLDPRDGTLKLMEVNFRSDMWHRTGAIAGVNLPEAQWLNASGLPVPPQKQSDEPTVYIYGGHEVANLIGRPGYWPRFQAILRHGRRAWAFWNPRDPLPFVHSLKIFVRLVLKACSRRSTSWLRKRC